MLTLVLPILLFLTPSFAAPTPTSPDSATVVPVGQDIVAMWDADTTGTWTNMEIQLMTGPNLDMIPLEILGSNIDATKTTTFSSPAPDVSPYSAIYFLQFTMGGDESTATWTTRFTIAGPDGSSTPPTNETVWNGQNVQWGTGVLLSGGSDSSTSPDATASASSSSGQAVNALASTSASAASSSASATSSMSSMSSMSSSSTMSSVSSMSSMSSTTSASTASSPSATHSGGAAKQSVLGGGIGLAVLSALMAFVL